MGNIIITIILAVISIVCFVISYLQFHEKGFLFNNAYIYASKQERETMDKKTHYKQSGMVFLLIGIMFLINTAEAILKTDWLFYMAMAVAVITIVYAIVSSITTEIKKKS